MVLRGGYDSCAFRGQRLSSWDSILSSSQAPSILPQWLRFKDWKRWMRAELTLWSIVVLTGVGTYYAWYIAPFR